MTDAPKTVFSDAAVAYAAFNLRDNYYREMSEKVAQAASARAGRRFRTAVDLGCGIGISTMSLMPHADRVIAIEPEEDMRRICNLHFMGNPRVTVIEGRAESLSDIIRNFGHVDGVCMSQMVHLLNPPNTQSLIPHLAQQVAKVLTVGGGVFAFDLGPSNYAFATKLADHRSGTFHVGEVRTEFSHPIYQMAERIIWRMVKEEFPSFERENLWPDPAKRMSFEFLSESFKAAGLVDLEVSEDLVPLSGNRIIEFIRNAWAVFFRWGELAKIPNEQKTALVGRMMRELYLAPNFEAMKSVTAYHPTAVFTGMNSGT